MKSTKVLTVILSMALASPVTAAAWVQKAVRADGISSDEENKLCEGIPIDENAFPDAEFCSFVKTEIDDGDGVLSEEEMLGVKEIDCSDCGISSVEGIELFPNLTLLYCFQNSIQKLDLSNNPKLTNLVCFGNPITEVDVSSCPALVETYEKGELEETEVYRAYFLENNGVVYEIVVNPTTKLIVEKAGPDPVVPDPDDPDPIIPDPDDPDPVIPEPEPDPGPDPLLPDPATDRSFEEFIERLYVVALARTSDPTGKAFWMDKVLNEGFSGGRCAIGFLIEAPEFLNRNLANDQFVDVLYKTFFDREADAAGKAFWIGHLTSDMTREQVVRGFVDSTEWCNLCATYGVKSGSTNAKAEKPSNNAIRFAYRLYSVCLGRRPDEAGLNFWALRLTNLECSGAQAARDFFTSKEFKNLGVNDVEFVTLLYQAFMDRTPDGTGMGFWLQHLATDMTRDQVLKGFAESEEFGKICRQYGIERGTL